MSEQNKQPWKAYEDEQARKRKEADEAAALFLLKEWLKEHTIDFTENVKGNLINISSDKLISRKEIIKILTLTKSYLGVQFYQGEIAIYSLYTKIPVSQAVIITAETATAKLRNQLTPLYSLAQMVLTFEKRPEIKDILIETAKLSVDSQLKITELLKQIELEVNNAR